MTLSDLGKSVIVATVLFVLFGVPSLTLDIGPQACVVVSAATKVRGSMQLYYDLGDGMSEELSSKVPLSDTGDFVEYRMVLPRRTIRGLRLDPLDAPGKMAIRKVELLDSRGKPVRTFSAAELEPVYQIASFAETERGIELETIPGGNDPAILFTLAKPLPLGRSLACWLGRTALVYGALLGACLLLASAPVRRLAGRPWRFATEKSWVFAWVAGSALWLYYLALPAASDTVLDASWQQALALARENDLAFGRDLIFTAGPYGHLFAVFTTPASLAARFVWELGGKVLLFAALATSLGFLPFWRRLAFVAFCVVFAGLFPDTIWCVLILVVALDTLLPGGRAGWRDGLALATVCFLGLVKFSFLLLAVAAVGCAALAALLRRDWRRALWLPVAAGFLFSALWLLAGQSLAVLPSYLANSLELSEGYAWSMIVVPTWSVFLCGIGVFALSSLALWNCVRTGQPPSRAWPVGLLCAFALYLSWRHGFTRADGHVLGFFGFALLLACALPAAFGRRPGLAWSDGIVLLCVLGFWCADFRLMRATNVLIEARFEARMSDLARLDSFSSRWKADFELKRRANALPQICGRVGEATVDVFNYEQGYALLNGLNYRPRPVPQSYSVHTVGLERANLAFYRSRRAPEYVLFRVGSIDERYPSQDDALVFAELPRLYQPVATEAGFSLLRRRTEARTPPQQRRELLLSRTVASGDAIPVPGERTHALWLQVEAEPTLLGRLRALFYRPSALELVVTDDEGVEVRHRLLPKTSGEGFLIYPDVRSQEAFEAYMRGGARGGLRSIRVECANLDLGCWKPFVVTFSRLSDMPISAAR